MRGFLPFLTIVELNKLISLHTLPISLFLSLLLTRVLLNRNFPLISGFLLNLKAGKQNRLIELLGIYFMRHVIVRKYTMDSSEVKLVGFCTFHNAKIYLFNAKYSNCPKTLAGKFAELVWMFLSFSKALRWHFRSILHLNPNCEIAWFCVSVTHESRCVGRQRIGLSKRVSDKEAIV